MVGEISREKWDLRWEIKGENYSGKEMNVSEVRISSEEVWGLRADSMGFEYLLSTSTDSKLFSFNFKVQATPFYTQVMLLRQRYSIKRIIQS